MRKIVVASQNPVKIQATLSGFCKMFEREEFEVVGIKVSTQFNDQPKSDDETLEGALARVNSAMELISDSDFWVGIEGGVEEDQQEFLAFAWIAIKSKHRFGKSRTGTFVLPKIVSDLIRKGMELGEADDIVFNRKNSKQDDGAVGIMTGNVIDRKLFYEHAIILALVAFKNPGLYPEGSI